MLRINAESTKSRCNLVCRASPPWAVCFFLMAIIVAIVYSMKEIKGEQLQEIGQQPSGHNFRPGDTHMHVHAQTHTPTDTRTRIHPHISCVFHARRSFLLTFLFGEEVRV